MLIFHTMLISVEQRKLLNIYRKLVVLEKDMTKEEPIHYTDVKDIIQGQIVELEKLIQWSVTK